MSSLLMEEEFFLFVFGLIRKFLDRTSSIVSGKDGIDLSLCGLDCDWRVITISIGDYVVIVNFERVAIYISIIKLGL